MQITDNTTPFLAERFVSIDKQSRKHCVVVVKATFEVDRAGHCSPSDTSTPLVYVDQHHGDPGTTSVRFETDFAPIKPKVDVLVHARAMSPDGGAVTSLRVEFAGAGLQKRAIVTGNRHWSRSLSGFKASDPEPFLSMPLSWDRAFGGTDTSVDDPPRSTSEFRNLAGVGFRVYHRKDAILDSALPNVEREDQPMRNWADKPEPVGFAPVGRSWQPRMRYAGTYDRQWFSTRRPFLPEDFDTRYFQAAPHDQQLERLLPGTRFVCVHMSARGKFVAETPAFEIPVLFQFDNRRARASLTADTLLLEPAQERLTLIGRVSIPLPRKLAELREIHVGERRLSHIGSKPHYRSLSDLVDSSRAGHNADDAAALP